eukprot:IDg2207t1
MATDDTHSHPAPISILAELARTTSEVRSLMNGTQRQSESMDERVNRILPRPLRAADLLTPSVFGGALPFGVPGGQTRTPAATDKLWTYFNVMHSVRPSRHLPRSQFGSAMRMITANALLFQFSQTGWQETPTCLSGRSGHGLTRQELDSRVTRDAFWEEVVARAFNEATPITTVDFGGVLGGIVPSSTPTSPRSGADLKKQYTDARGQFALATPNGRDRACIGTFGSDGNRGSRKRVAEEMQRTLYSVHEEFKDFIGVFCNALSARSAQACDERRYKKMMTLETVL